MYIKPLRTSKQASEWQNVNNNSVGTDLRARGVEEEHDSYQQCLKHVTLRHAYKSSAYFGKMSVTAVLEQICMLEMLKSTAVTSSVLTNAKN